MEQVQRFFHSPTNSGDASMRLTVLLVAEQLHAAEYSVFAGEGFCPESTLPHITRYPVSGPFSDATS